MGRIRSLAKHKVTRLIAITALLLTGALQVFGHPTGGIAQTTDGPTTGEWLIGPAVTDGDLLKNGGLNGNYYWKFPNHYTAPEWGRWWIDGSVLPEFDRTRGSEPFIEGDRAQRMHKWGSTFVSGIYQVASVTPCTNHQLDGWIRSDSVTGAHPNTRIGLDPTGTQLTSSQSSGAVYSGLPTLTSWSSKGLQLFTWEHFTAQAEAFGDRMTAILYAAPQPGSGQTHYYAIYFDEVSLTTIAFPDGKLPAPSLWTPSPYVQNIATDYTTPTLTIQWSTSDASSTQILYSVTQSVITPTDSMTHTVFLPLIHQADRLPYLDSYPTTNHQATIRGLKTGDVVRFIALSRRVSGTSCATETSFPYEITIGSDQLIQLDSSEAAALYAGPGIR